MFLHDELRGVTLRELPNGHFERVERESPPPETPRPVHLVDVSLPDWFEETAQEAIKCCHGASKNLTFAERVARDAWRGHIAERRHIMLARLAACDVPADHTLKCIGVESSYGGESRRLLRFRDKVQQWLVNTSDGILLDAMVAFERKADDMEAELRSVNGSTRSSSPDTLEALAIARTNALRIHLARGEIKATRNAGYHWPSW